MDIMAILEQYPPQQDYLIEMLIDIDKMKDDHSLTVQELELVANYCDVRTSHVCSVMSFYTLLSTEPRGKYIVQVCKDVPCYLNDEFNVLRTVEETLGIRLGETTHDEQFSIEQTACIGCCDEAPAMRINDRVYTKLTYETVIDILEEYRGGRHD